MKLVFVLILSVYVPKCECFKVHFVSCQGKGFYCDESASYPGKLDVTYQCPNDDLQDITIDFLIWNLPQNANVSKITIRHCHTLRLSFGCEPEYQRIDILHVHHVVDLRISQDDTICNPSAVIFEEIDLLRSIPKYAFSQTLSVCKNDECGLHQLVFENVKVGAVETNAIELSNSIKLFRLTNTVIDSIKVCGIKILDQKNASIYIMNSFINNLEPLAIQIISRQFTITDTSFGRLSFGGISATLKTFEFNSNTISVVSSGGLAISAGRINVINNRFHTLHTGALSQVGSHEDKFELNFLGNYIKYVDGGGLHPHPDSISRFRSTITYENNLFHCTCRGLSWLGSDINFGVAYDSFKDFYRNILNKTKNNTCTFDTGCTLPLKAVTKINANGRCQTITVRDQLQFCENYQEGSSTQFVGSVKLFILSLLYTIYYYQYLFI